MVNSIWSQFEFPSGTYFNHSTVAPVTIAVLEMCGIVAGALLAAQAIQQRPHSTPHHLHIVTDNTNAYYWSLSHKSQCPLLYFFLQLLSLIAAQHSLLITHSWTPSEDNPVADAISRNFRGPGMDAHLQLLRRTCRQVPIPPAFLSSTRSASGWPHADPLRTIRLALTPLDGTNFCGSVTSSK